MLTERMWDTSDLPKQRKQSACWLMNINYYKRSNSAKHRINRVSGKKSICLKFVFWYFKYQLLQKIGRPMSQEFQNFMFVAPTYSKDCYHTFLVKYHGFDRNCWPTNKNPRLRDLAAKNLRIRDARKRALREMSNFVEFTRPWYSTTLGESWIGTRRVRKRDVS